MIVQSLLQFWSYYPGFLLGASALLGVAIALYPPFPSLLLFLLLALLAKDKKYRNTLVIFFIGFLFSFAVAYFKYHFPDADDIKTGKANITITSKELSKTNFGYRYKYKAHLNSYTSQLDNAYGFDVKFTLSADVGAFQPDTGKRYQIRARLKKNLAGSYTLSSIDKNSWKPLGSVLNLVKWRFDAKNAIKENIAEAIKNKHVAAFLSGMATGQFDDMALSIELGRFGLQHLMAISGLHFSIIATILSILLSLVFQTRTVSIAVIVLLSGYFILLGPSASVMRAWVTIVIAFLGLLLERQSLGINSLGIALFLVAIFDPLAIGTIAFQFSFGITAAILILSKPIEAMLEKVLPKRDLSDVLHMPTLSRISVCSLSFLRSGLSLMFAVNLIAMPLTLYHFHKFPLMSLLYNLFFPFMVSLSMLLLLLALLTTPLPNICHLFHTFNERYTDFLLNLTFGLPRSFDTHWTVENIPLIPLTIYLIALLTGAMAIHKKNQGSLQEHIII